MRTHFNEQDINSLIKSGIDLCIGKKTMDTEPLKFSLIDGKYSFEQANELFNKKIIKVASEKAGIAYNDGKIDWYTYSSPAFQHAFFNLIPVVIDAIIPKVLTTQFDILANVRNAAWGDKMVIEVTSSDLFSVSKIANGTSNLRRQRLDRRAIELLPVMRGVKVAESIFRILSGQADWATFINKVAISVATDVKNTLYTTFYNSYTSLSATYGVTGAFSTTTFNTMVEHVRAANGGLAPVAMGTRLALQKVLPATGVSGLTSMNMLDAYNQQGYLGVLNGTPMFCIEQAHVPNTDTFAVNDNFVAIIPMGSNKPVHIGFEGEGIVTTNANELNANMEMEYTYQKAYDVQVLSAAKYGIYRLT